MAAADGGFGGGEALPMALDADVVAPVVGSVRPLVAAGEPPQQQQQPIN